MYKVKNKTNEPRKFREHKVGALHFLRAGEEIIISNAPATNRTDVFEITELNLEEEPEKPKKRKIVERRST
ncbi:hypothetical protein LCGC14_1335980 [marine sediment metagenome]|uniref:Uncharacterized protein n=1 Tax=marine sediment metagenome TaxID=412755 RepID=A0A0F9NHK2_9ZZZZ